MGAIRTSADATFRDYVTDGVPASGVHDPLKSDTRDTMGVIEDRVDDVEASATAGLRWTTNIVRTRSTANVVIATGLVNLTVLNGVTLATGNHVFLGSQTDTKENGLYTVVASGAAARATFADAAAELAYIAFRIAEGTVGTGESWTLPLAAASIVLGTTSLVFAPTGIDNASVRVGANIAAGADAGKSFTTGTGSVGLGDGALRDTAAGLDNAAIGRASGRANVAGNYNTYFGAVSGLTATGATGCVGIGYEALGYGLHGNLNTAAGYRAASSFAGIEITALGANAFFGIAAGVNLTGVGVSAGTGASGTHNNLTFLGHNAGGSGISHVSGDNQTAIGSGAKNTANNQVSLGNDTVEDVRACGTVMYRAYLTPRTYFFANAGNRTTGNNGTIGIGEAALAVAATVENGVFIGDLTGQSLTTGNGCTALGARALNLATSMTDTTMVGNRAGRAMLTGVGSTGVGFRVLEYATASRNDTALGDSAFWLHQGNGGTAVGYRVAEYTTAGNESTYVGNATGVNRANGDQCVFVGAEAGGFHTAVVDPATGVGAVSAGSRVIGIGYRAMSLTTGNDHVGVGSSAGLSLTGAGSGSIFIGSGAGNNASQKVAPVNQIVIGQDAFSANDNEVVLGNASITRTVLRGVQIGTTYTVATLPTAAAAGAGARSFVTDANATTFASVVAGGGANGVPVYSDATNWRIG